MSLTDCEALASAFRGSGIILLIYILKPLIWIISSFKHNPPGVPLWKPPNPTKSQTIFHDNRLGEETSERCL